MRRLYDEAVVAKIQKWTRNSDLTITAPDQTEQLFRAKADIGNDEPIKLPLIAISRNDNLDLIINHKRAMSHKGLPFVSNGVRGEIMTYIPINFSYQMDIYTRHREENDDYVREFIFAFINQPKIIIEVPFNDSKRTIKCNIRMQPTVADNSDVPSHLIRGEFFRSTFTLYIDDGYLVDYKSKKTSLLILDDFKNDDEVEFDGCIHDDGRMEEVLE